MNYGKLTAGTTKTAIDTAKPSEKGEIITYLSRMGDVLEQIFERYKIVFSVEAVYVVVDGDKPYTVAGEHQLSQFPDFQVFTSKPGQILDDQGPHHTALNEAHR